MKFSRLFWMAAVLTLAGCHPRSTPPAAMPVATPPPFVSPILFSDRAEAAGIRFQLGHGGKSPLTILDTAGCGCAFLDYDGDGLLDVLLVGQPHCALYRNKGNGIFEDVTARAGLTATGTFMGAAVGDYDNDGRPDILITGYGRNVLYHNLGRRFEEVTAQAGVQARSPSDWATSATFADLDNDGRLDLIICHYVTITPKTLQTCGYEGVQAACPPFYYPPQTVMVFRNEGGGHFRDVTRAWGFAGGHGNNLGVAAADFDDDGRADLYIANDGLPADLWHNTGKGFVNIAERTGTAYDGEGRPQAGMGVDWADYDGDGKLDLMVTTFQDQAKALYHNEGNAQFRFASYGIGLGAQTANRLAFGVLFEDFDNDGWPDILIANGHVQDTIQKFHAPATYAQTPQCFWNRGDGTFQEVSSGCGPAFAAPIVGRGLASGDYDNDGRMDALMVDLEGRPLLLHNDSPPAHWLGVKLIGVRSNRDGIGARVTLDAGGRRRIHEVQSGRSYLSACDTRVLFGLGKTSGPVTLTIHWPSGRTEHFSLAKTDRYITLREGSGQ